MVPQLLQHAPKRRVPARLRHIAERLGPLHRRLLLPKGRVAARVLDEGAANGRRRRRQRVLRAPPEEPVSQRRHVRLRGGGEQVGVPLSTQHVREVVRMVFAGGVAPARKCNQRQSSAHSRLRVAAPGCLSRWRRHVLRQ